MSNTLEDTDISFLQQEEMDQELNQKSILYDFLAKHFSHLVLCSILTGLIILISATYFSIYLHHTIFSLMHTFGSLLLYPIFYLFFCLFHSIFKSFSHEDFSNSIENEENNLISS